MNIAVYCGASLGSNTAYQDAAQKVGKWIAEKNNTLVYGGGKAGLMGVVADEVLANNGEVIGIIPDFLVERELSHANLTTLEIVDSMSVRKNRMIALSDCYIALPGGPGTLEEIAEVISWARVGQNQNPCILFNQNGYYDSLARFYDEMVENGFLSVQDRERILFTDSLEEIEVFISDYTPPEVRKYTAHSPS
ncbi:TIGR00730 family Rossman fold protein [Oceanobacillus sp. FSL W8-0428]|uniref:Cytokinin riboside 5'-monophosphate phosphoribohydrolase n=1 Tax=Oceanobacillus sojae TaxID=582851 RepID=A0A511ZH48_9BACI|nr:TIGR00730 family Rossman fold protein [Oceanobacillus sojae]GEN86765.1 cytokinin riboside 5'-monophosphate phosphoribohydrolase [Oceanobacillus sojae]